LWTSWNALKKSLATEAAVPERKEAPEGLRWSEGNAAADRREKACCEKGAKPCGHGNERKLDNFGGAKSVPRRKSPKPKSP